MLSRSAVSPVLRSRITSVALVVLLCAFMLANADLPDPIWIGGIWDGGDTGAAPARSADVLHSSGHILVVGAEPTSASHPPAPRSRPVSRPVDGVGTRAPPSA